MKEMKLVRAGIRLLLVMSGLTLLASVVSAQLSGDELAEKDTMAKLGAGIALGGCGIQTGAAIGATNAKGTEVTDREVHGGHLFHTYLQALGIDSTANHDIPGREIPIGDPAVEAIKELLS